MGSDFSFDIVSDFDKQELLNAVDQTQREISNRFDLKNTNSSVELEAEKSITITTADDMKLKNIVDILQSKLVKRNLSIKILDAQNVENALGGNVRQVFNLKKGLPYAEQGNEANYYLALVYQKTKRTELEKKYLAAYLKKAAPDAKFRKAAEDRMAEINAPVAVDTVASTETQAGAEPAKNAVKDSAKNAIDAVQASAVDSSKPVEVPAAASAPVVTEGNSIANANMLFKAGSLEAALQMYKALLDTEVSPDERYFAMLQMGNIYREMRDFHSAVTRYREVVQQFPDSDWATEAERALEDAVWLEKHSKELPARKR